VENSREPTPPEQILNAGDGGVKRYWNAKVGDDPEVAADPCERGDCLQLSSGDETAVADLSPLALYPDDL